MKHTRNGSSRGGVRKAWFGGATLLLMATVAACGGSSTESGEGGPTKVKVGVFAAADVAPLYLGIREGLFEKEGLDLEAQIMDSGAAVTAAVVAGDAQFGYSNTLSLVIARSQNLPITIVAPGVAAGKDSSEANAAVMVQKESPIQDTADLAGKKVAVNALGNILEVTLRNALKQAGEDPSDVTLVEVPFPEMPAALDGGQVDAAFMLEPFITNASVGDGARAVSTPYEEVTPSFNAGVYFSTDQFVSEDADTQEAFNRGLRASVDYANENPDEARAIVTDYLSIPPEVAKVMKFPQFITEPDLSHVEIFADLGREYGLVDGEVDIEALTAGVSD